MRRWRRRIVRGATAVDVGVEVGIVEGEESLLANAMMGKDQPEVGSGHLGPLLLKIPRRRRVPERRTRRLVRRLRLLVELGRREHLRCLPLRRGNLIRLGTNMGA